MAALLPCPGLKLDKGGIGRASTFGPNKSYTSLDTEVVFSLTSQLINSNLARLPA